MRIAKKHRKDKLGSLARRHMRIRKKVAGTEERPRLLVRKSLKHIYAIVIDDSNPAGSHTLAEVTTNTKDAAKNKSHRNVESAKRIGSAVAETLKAKGVKAVVFDRGGYRYHGCVKALCEAVREAGIQV